MRWAIPLLLGSGCTSSIIKEFNATKSAALADPGPAPANWEPDLVVQLSDAAVAETISPILESQIAKKTSFKFEILGITATGDANVKVKQLDLSESSKCPDCLKVDATLKGNVDWSFAGEKGSIPATIDVGLDVQFEATQIKGVWTVQVAAKDVRKAKVDLGSSGKIAAPLEGELAEWARERIQDLPPFELGDLGGPELPLRGVRVGAVDNDLQLSILTASPTPGKVAPPKNRVEKGYRLWFASESLVGLAKKQAFQRGPVGYDVVPEPTSLDLQEDSFTLGLRLWRPVGAGWWRDYTVSGDLDSTKKAIKLKAKEVVEGKKSKGAAWADPLAALGEGYILKTLEQAIQTSLPAKQGGKVGESEISARFEHFKTHAGVIQIDGSLQQKESTKSK